METCEPKERRQKGGHYCIAPGCKNEFYRVKAEDKAVHFHKLPLKRRAVLLRWLAVLKRKNLPMGPDARICSDHFLEEDYIEQKCFEYGKLVTKRTNRLNPEAAPSVFNFTADNRSSTNRPACYNSRSASSIHRSERARKRTRKAGERQMSSDQPAAGGGSAGKAPPSSVVSGNGNWEGAASMDQITVVRIDDTHIAEEQCHGAAKVKDVPEFYEVEYSLPAAEEVVGEDEDDGVYVIEYSNPEEEGESYQFTMSVDRPLPTKKQIYKHPVQRESARAPVPLISKAARPTRPRQEARKRKLLQQKEEEDEEELEEEEDELKEEVVSNKSVLELGEDYSGVMAMNSGKGPLVCTLCPPPGKFFKRGAGLAVHLKHMHFMQGKKTFFCTSCQQSVRTQIELDQHTRRHANQDAVFTCSLCSPQDSGYRGSKAGLKKHLEAEHPGVIPRCHVCHRAFKSLMSYLADQFRHVGVSPYHCAQCQIYEMTERGLTIHIKNHDKKKKLQQQPEAAENRLQAPGVPAGADDSATDDSDA